MKKIFALMMLLALLTACGGGDTPPTPDTPTLESEPQPEVEDDTSPDTNASESFDIASMPSANIMQTDAYYQMQSMFMEDQDKCLESRDEGEPILMSGCQDEPEQLWKITPLEDGIYTVQSLSLIHI